MKQPASQPAFCCILLASSPSSLPPAGSCLCDGGEDAIYGATRAGESRRGRAEKGTEKIDGGHAITRKREIRSNTLSRAMGWQCKMCARIFHTGLCAGDTEDGGGEGGVGRRAGRPEEDDALCTLLSLHPLTPSPLSPALDHIVGRRMEEQSTDTDEGKRYSIIFPLRDGLFPVNAVSDENACCRSGVQNEEPVFVSR